MLYVVQCYRSHFDVFYRIELLWAQKIEWIWVEGKFIGECSEHAICTNNDGSYDCECNIGFIGDGFQCTNIDECTDANAAQTEEGPSQMICAEFAHCIDTVGSYKVRDSESVGHLVTAI